MATTGVRSTSRGRTSTSTRTSYTSNDGNIFGSAGPVDLHANVSVDSDADDDDGTDGNITFSLDHRTAAYTLALDADSGCGDAERCGGGHHPAHQPDGGRWSD